MKISDEISGTFNLEISREDQITRVSFNPKYKLLIFKDIDPLSALLKRNEYQFRKVLHIKRPETYYPGFELNFALTDGKDVAAFNDLTNIVVLDNTKEQSIIYTLERGKYGIHEIYIDGSYLKEKGKGGYAIIGKSPEGNYALDMFSTKIKSSSLIELQAAIKALELYNKQQEIRINTDSQYVRKGLTEWIVNWKLNNWKTASGKQVKNIRYWKKFDELTQNKYLEFKYIKAHSSHFENTMADLYAKDMANRTEINN
jgi:ribonuclease HI